MSARTSCIRRQVHQSDWGTEQVVDQEGMSASRLHRRNTVSRAIEYDVSEKVTAAKETHTKAPSSAEIIAAGTSKSGKLPSPATLL